MNYYNEEWKLYHCDDWLPNQKFLVSNHGRVKSLVAVSEGRLLKGGTSQGFLIINHIKKKDGKRTGRYFHRMVAELFLEKKEDDKYIIHKNYEKKDNRVSNLKWVNKEEWVAHQKKNPNVIEAKLMRKTKRHYSKLTETQVKMIKRKINDPNRKTRMKIIAKQYGISLMQLYRIKSGENWGNVSPDNV
ncbi:HNH endonuclease [Aureivirga sp. CE67]|uniref:HNH endonuclease n=1 Tax=Aureivirga sp. CE67 TaxID=1788983 RepID=UPI0018CA8039|nr:HNH endonuclease [Aureivirga sp. CE67]